MQPLLILRAPGHTFLAALLLLCACAEPAHDIGKDDPRRAAARAVEGFEVAEGLAVTLFASEPMITNPTNIDVDARGRVWVCEAVNYRPDYNPHHKVQQAGDRIVILEDTTGDGRADVRKVFYQGTDVNAALGIAVFGNKVIVSSSPNVWVFTDENGDDKPESKEVLFTGIGGLQDDHGVHAFVFGPGGRWYFNFGNAGSQLMGENGSPITDPAGRVIEAVGAPFQQGMALRTSDHWPLRVLAPGRYSWPVEVLGHNFRNPYELTVDAFGTVWQSDNDDDGNRGVRINYVMEYGNYGYRDELTGAHWSTRRTGMHDEVPLRHWHQNDPGVVPNALQTGAGSPTGITMYEGTLLPPPFHNQIIHADAGPGVVRAYAVTKDGAGYSAKAIDILTSPGDQWFRPSDVAVAPDGSLIVSDWYDATVGGNQAVDQERGRIFRLAPPGEPYSVTRPDFADMEAAAAALMSPNVATRAEAFHSLVSAREGIHSYLRPYLDADNPRHVARAIWAAKSKEFEGGAYVDVALEHDDPDIRVVGVRLAREIGRDLIPVGPLVRRLVGDPAPEVRREAILTLRHAQDPAAASLWAELAVQHDGQDRWYLEALGIAADGQWDRYFGAWLAATGDDWRTPAGRDIVWRSRAAAAAPLLVQLIINESTRADERDRYFRALDFHAPEAKYPLFSTVITGGHGDRAVLLHRALLHLADPDAEPDRTVRGAIDEFLDLTQGTQAFLDIVDRFQVTSQEDALQSMVFDTTSTGLGRQATALLVKLHGVAVLEDALSGEAAQMALRRLSSVGSAATVALLESVALDLAQPSDLRRQATAAMASSGAGQARLLELIAAGAVPAAQVDAVRGHLLNVWDVEQRMAAEAALGVPEDRNAEPLPPLRSLLVATGNPRRGRTVFKTHCSQCHSTKADSGVLGPGLGDIGAKLSRAALFEAILHPSAGISKGYEAVAVALSDGTKHVGRILDETPRAVRLRTADGLTLMVARDRIQSQTPFELSLMPELQQVMTREELVDLVAFLQSLGGA